MAKQQDTQKQRYTIQCRNHKPLHKWNAETITPCELCGNTRLFADDHHRATSRNYFNGVQVDE